MSNRNQSGSSFRAGDYEKDGKYHLLLAASGSVASIKIPNIIEALATHPNISICLVLTKSATNFLAGQSTETPHLQTLQEFDNVQGIFLDEDEWVPSWKRGADILHIELRRWAHLMVIAPLSANTLAKIVGGLSDNLLTSVVRAWDTTGLIEAPAQATITGPGHAIGKKRIIVAPAMNTAMWRHPITARQIRVLEEDWGVGDDDENGNGNDKAGWVQVMRPKEKELACGDVGDGAMKEWKEIVAVIEHSFGLRR